MNHNKVRIQMPRRGRLQPKWTGGKPSDLDRHVGRILRGPALREIKHHHKKTH